MADDNGFGEWGGYMEAKITKLEEQFSAASAPFKKSNLFVGISIFVNGLTDPSADELKRIMMIHGGTFHHYERLHTTYIIASNLPDVKVRNMDTSKIISAKWVVDCVKENRLIDYTKYLLYTNQKASQPRLNFSKQKKEEPPSDKPAGEEVTTTVEDFVKSDDQEPKSLSETAKSDVQADIKPNLSNSTLTARTAVDPNFLPEFYNNSRLHHIATLGAGFKQYVTDLREKHDENFRFPARLKLREKLIDEGVKIRGDDLLGSSSALIMHIDMDCFFVSVGLRNHPHLRGKPVAVTHSKGGPGAADVPVHPKADREAEMELFTKRFEQQLHNNILSDKVRAGFDAKMSLSEIASCSYEARSKGIRNGMFVGQAIKLCPELKTIPYDFEGYKEVAFALYDTIAQYTLKIEAVSCDELFVDLSDIIDELKIQPMNFVQAVRSEVREKTGCPCSAGVGANKLQARMATRRAKPDGQYHLEADNVIEYMKDISVDDLPGVGSSTKYVLEQAGYTTGGDLQRLSLEKLQTIVGKKFGETLHQFCRGLDNRSLNYEQIRKSVSAEVNYGIRFKEYTEVQNFLRQLCGEVHSRLCKIKRKTKCVTLKVMIRATEAPVETSKFMGHGVCDYITKSISLGNFTNELDVIIRSVLTIMKNLKLPPHELRGIGIQLTKLDQPKSTYREAKEKSIKDMFCKIKTKQKKALERPLEKSNEDNESKEIKFKNVPPQLSDVSDKNTQKPTVKKRSNILDMLHKSRLKKQRKTQSDFEQQQCIVSSTSEIKESTDPEDLPPDIDRDVFSALPLDIRREIINNNRRLRESEVEIKTISSNSCNAIKTTKPVDILIKSKSPPLMLAPLSPPFSPVQLADEELDLQPSTSRAAEERRVRKRLLQSQTEGLGQVDPRFLQALPLDLRSEIEADMAAQLSNSVPPTFSEGFSAISPTASVAKETTTPTTTSTKSNTLTAARTSIISTSSSLLSLEENIFMQPNCNELLLQWVKTSVAPKTYDINLCCQHARDMARCNNLTILYGAIAYFRKLIEKKHSKLENNAWYKAYCDIIKTIVEEVDKIYPGRNLLTRDMNFLLPN